MICKRGSILHKVLIHIIIIGILFFVFFSAMGNKFESRDVKRQVLEKELALLIDSAEAGMRFDVFRSYNNGIVAGVRIEDGRVFVDLDGYPSVEGYPYFSRYSIDVESDNTKFMVMVG